MIPSSPKLLFIVNPSAGAGRCASMAKKIQLEMANHPWNCEVLLSRSQKDAFHLAKDAAVKGFHAVIAVGGDGTVNTVLQGLLASSNPAPQAASSSTTENSPGAEGFSPVNAFLPSGPKSAQRLPTLGFLPAGTGNDLAKTLELPKNYREGLKRILKWNWRVLDYGLANGHPFLNSASMGFDTQVVSNTTIIKHWIKSTAAYKLGILQAFFNYKGGAFHLKDENSHVEGNLFLIAVSNGKYYGGGYPILPMAEMNDGFLDICLVKDLPKRNALKLLPHLTKGTHIQFPNEVQIWRSSGLTLSTRVESLLDINIDGELVRLVSPINIQIVEKGLVFIG